MKAPKEMLKTLLGELPGTAEIYWLLRQGQYSGGHFSLRRLQKYLPQLLAQTMPFAQAASPGRQVFIFATLHYWIEHAALLGLALTGQGHRVTLAYLPYADWRKPLNRFDLRRRDMYTLSILRLAELLLKPLSLLQAQPVKALPSSLQSLIDQVTVFDTQYTLQIEDVNPLMGIYRLRRERNNFAACTTFGYFQAHRADVVIVPNGMILEFGAIYEVARHLGIPVVSYEFGDQANRVWMAQESQIVRHETDDLWESRRPLPLSKVQREWLEKLLKGRQNTTPDSTFARLYPQFADVQGGKRVRAVLGLDSRPVVLLPTNVLGDSLTLGRQVFTATMTEWITRLVHYFVNHPEVQLVVRIHPGEVISRGPSIREEIEKVVPELPEHIHFVNPKDPINTYDLLEIADLGLVYTTTTGLEMATRGIPVIIGGKTHYRNRGFTIDPNSWDEYFASLDRVLADLPGHRLTPEQLGLAWNYAYRFFREYPRPFPWHLACYWDDLRERPMEYVLSAEGQAQYASTFRQMAGEPMDWSAIE